MEASVGSSCEEGRVLPDGAGIAAGALAGAEHKGYENKQGRGGYRRACRNINKEKESNGVH
jgi:hypothetical protein